MRIGVHLSWCFVFVFVLFLLSYRHGPSARIHEFLILGRQPSSSSASRKTQGHSCTGWRRPPRHDASGHRPPPLGLDRTLPLMDHRLATHLVPNAAPSCQSRHKCRYVFSSSPSSPSFEYQRAGRFDLEQTSRHVSIHPKADDADLTRNAAMRLVTYNLRYDSRPDNITVQQSVDNLPDPLDAPGYQRKSGEQPWSVRRLRVAEQLLGEGIVLAGFQEALVRQVHDLAELFSSDWDWVGSARCAADGVIDAAINRSGWAVTTVWRRASTVPFSTRSECIPFFLCGLCRLSADRSSRCSRMTLFGHRGSLFISWIIYCSLTDAETRLSHPHASPARALTASAQPCACSAGRAVKYSLCSTRTWTTGPRPSAATPRA